MENEVQRNIKLEGINLSNVQESNRVLLLRLLKKNGVCSRVELAQQTGLKQATITNIVSDFIKWGLVKEVGSLSGEKGRRSIGISLDEKNFYVIGVRLTRQFFRVGLFDFSGKVVAKKKVVFVGNEKPKQVMATMINTVQRMQAEHKSKKILVIGVAVPGPYYPRLGRIVAVTEFQGWEDIHIKQEFEDAFDIPVLIEHDANAGVWAEWWKMPRGKDTGVIIYLAVGQGVGAGIVNEGQIFKGAFGTAGEIGHISINAFGEKCECNNCGCLTNYISTIRLQKRVRQEIEKGEDSILSADFTFKELAKAIRQKDKVAYTVFHEEIIRYLGTALVNLIWSYNPNKIIIGDEMTDVGKILIRELRSFVKAHTLEYLYEWIEIEMTELNDDPAFLGSGDLAIDYALSHIGIFDAMQETAVKQKE